MHCLSYLQLPIYSNRNRSGPISAFHPSALNYYNSLLVGLPKLFFTPTFFQCLKSKHSSVIGPKLSFSFLNSPAPHWCPHFFLGFLPYAFIHTVPLDWKLLSYLTGNSHTFTVHLLYKALNKVLIS